MTTGSLQDRRQFSQDRLAELSQLPGAEHPGPLRRIAASTLGFTPVTGTVIAVDNPQLPSAATVLAVLPNEFGPDYTAVHFDLPDGDGTRSRRSYVTNTVIQAANGLVQQYAGEECYPLLIFTLPDNGGVQFATGNPGPDNRYRLRDVVRVTAYWNSLNRTALDCLEHVGSAIINGEPPQRAFKSGFNVQPVTDEFFSDYKAAYDGAVKSLAQSIDRADAEQFTQTLFNRLLFIHFVSRKGWLRFSGDSDYLNALWRDYQTGSSKSNFYTNRLTALFFAGLNNPQSLDLMRDNSVMYELIGNVPFLNGGLFEETALDERAASSGFTVPDTVVEGLIGLFNRYNFTVMEATPLDTEVAVDPEMLGKLFEETVNERHSNGAYYTPRPVVAFMCREAIKGYLAGKGIAGLDDGKIAELVDHRNPDAITPGQALEVANAVAGMKAVDPACGSGAFLLGMLQEILALNDSLFRAGHTPETLYRQKLDIIGNNLYGADLDGMAVSTAMLRLWLSLAVDYDGGGPPEPLPNLDLKLVVGDTIAGPDPQEQELDSKQLDFTLQSIVNSGLRQEIVDYTTAHGQRKATLKEKVEATKQELRDNMNSAAPAGVVEWRIDFADVMLNGGFDVVIANPPYVQLQKDGGKLGDLYKDAGYQTFARTGDIYQLFYERGCQLLKPSSGLLAYITSNSWLKAEYGKSTRRYFAGQHTPLCLLELGKDVFESAIVDSSILLLREGRRDGASAVIDAVDTDKLAVKDFPPVPALWGLAQPDGDAPWSIMSRLERTVMDKMRAKGTPLKEWDVSINRGVTTGYNTAFIIDTATKEALVAKDPKSAEIIKPVLRGRDIQRYRAKWADIWLINIPWHFPLHLDSSIKGVSKKAEDLFKKQYPGVYAHLLSHKTALSARNKSETGIRYEWYALQRWAANYHEEFSKEKLVWMDLTEHGRFAFDADKMFCVNTVFTMTGQAIKYLCAMLNSNLITWYMSNTALNSGMGVTRWIGHTVERIPIPKITAAKQRPFVRLVDRILAAKASKPSADTSGLEEEIDWLVYDLYGLTEEETAVVRISFGKER